MFRGFRKNSKTKKEDKEYANMRRSGDSLRWEDEKIKEIQDEIANSKNTNTNINKNKSNQKFGKQPTKVYNKELWTKAIGPLFIGDKVRLANKRRGKVTSLAPKSDKEGLWVRVVVDNPVQGDMFQNKNSQTGKAIWVPIQKVDKVIERGNKFGYTIGDRVVYTKKKKKFHGTVRYVGPTHFDRGVWFGVELDEEKGKNNGTVRKKFYFKSAENHGVFVAYKRLQLEEDFLNENKKKNFSSQQNKNGKKKIFKSNEDNKNNVDTDDDSNNHNQSSNNMLPEPTQNDYKENSKIEKPKKLTEKENAFAGFLFLTDDEFEMSDEELKKDLQNSLDLEILRPQANINIVREYLTTKTQIDPSFKEYIIKTRELTGIELELHKSDLPQIISVNKQQRESIFLQKMKLCRAHCDFTMPSKEMQIMMDKKERWLVELSEFIAKHVWYKEKLYEEALKTVACNLFRALPYQPRPPVLSFFNDEVFDKDVNYEDPAWAHLKLVYDLTWRVINTPQVTAPMMEKHMKGKFLISLVELFASEDHRERAYLMMILHKIYGRCLKLRPYIIDRMSYYLYRMIYSGLSHVNGVIELLQIICAIIPGLTVPVKDVWQQFVRNVLVPLHKCRPLKKFWEQLTQCCVNYVAKDDQGGAVILGGLLKYWPKQSPQKEEIFIMECVNIINVLITHQYGFVYENYKDILIASADKLAKCMLSTRQPVAERAIAAWKEQSMQRLVDYDRKAFLPKLCEAFYKNKDNPNQALRQSSFTVEKIYRSKDGVYWKKMQQYLSKKEKKELAIVNALREAKFKGENPMLIIQRKQKKEKEKKKIKPLTNAEKQVKREFLWSETRSIAQENKKKIK